MVVACLGWGSLIWNPGSLPIRATWFQDGPLLPIEFARQSSNGCLTLVMVPGYSCNVRALWTLLAVADPAAAREALRARERVPTKNRDKDIGLWVTGDASPGVCPAMSEWASCRGIEAVVWTALGPRIGADERAPTQEEAVQYLRGLSHVAGQDAERYIRMAPRQVDTPYRRAFEAEFGWTPTGAV